MRKLIAILAGAAIASITFFLVAFIANTINPTPPELMDPQTPEAVAQRVDATSSGTWLSTIFGLALGSFVGGFSGIKIAKDKRNMVTTGIGVVLSLWAVYTFWVVYPKVLWVPVVMLISVFLFSRLGGNMVK